MGKIKAISFLCISVFCVSLFTACNSGKNTLDDTDKEEEKKVYDTIAAEDISHVNLKGNARSIVVKQGGNKYFEFDNADLNKDHKYEVRYEKKDHTLDINILMESSGTTIMFSALSSFTYLRKNLKKLKQQGNLVIFILRQSVQMC